MRHNPCEYRLGVLQHEFSVGVHALSSLGLATATILSPVRTARRGFITLHLYSVPLHVAISRLYLGGTSAVISPATVVLCRILDMDFGEFTF